MIRNLLIATLFFMAPLFTSESSSCKPCDIKMETEQIYNKGKEEVLSLLYKKQGTYLSEFIKNRQEGFEKPFRKFGSNPTWLNDTQLKYKPILFLNANNSSQGQWIPLIKSLVESGISNPIFTLNYTEENSIQKYREKIDEIRFLYYERGIKELDLILIGHSYGGLLAAEAKYLPELQIPKVNIDIVISIASRLKNVEPITDTPYFNYSSRLFERVDRLNLYDLDIITITAEKDWLLPRVSTHVGRERYIIPNTGHVLVIQNPNTINILVKLLK